MLGGLSFAELFDSAAVPVPADMLGRSTVDL